MHVAVALEFGRRPYVFPVSQIRFIRKSARIQFPCIFNRKTIHDYVQRSTGHARFGNGNRSFDEKQKSRFKNKTLHAYALTGERHMRAATSSDTCMHFYDNNLSINRFFNANDGSTIFNARALLVQYTYMFHKTGRINSRKNGESYMSIYFERFYGGKVRFVFKRSALERVRLRRRETIVKRRISDFT